MSSLAFRHAPNRNERKDYDVHKRTTRVAVLLTALAAIGGGAAGVSAIAGAADSGGTGSPRLDDGKNLVSQAKISESRGDRRRPAAASGCTERSRPRSS